jgi:molybdopterin-guanine dinucleotide biosynthesis protein A
MIFNGFIMDTNFKSVIILCGGMSRRMGQDKGSMKINNKPMIINLLLSINNHIDEAIIVVNDKNRVLQYQKLISQYIDEDNRFSYDIIFKTDDIKNNGPLSGILTGLKNINSNYALVLPCDSPFIDNEYIEKIFNFKNTIAKNYNSIIPYFQDNNSIFTKKVDLKKDLNKEILNSQGLHGIYSKKEIAIIEDLLKKDIKDIKSFIKKSISYFIPIEDNFNELNFKNFNTLNDFNDIINLDEDN